MMENKEKRLWLFLVGCIGTRALLVYLAKTASPYYLEMMGWLALIPAIGFYYIWITGARKTGGEVFGDKIWWDHLRPIHGTIYALFAYFAIRRQPFAWLFLLGDVIFGLANFGWNRYQ